MCNCVFFFSLFQDRGSLLSFIAGFLTFMSIGGFPSFVEDMKVVVSKTILARTKIDMDCL